MQSWHRQLYPNTEVLMVGYNHWITEDFTFILLKDVSRCAILNIIVNYGKTIIEFVFTQN